MEKTNASELALRRRKILNLNLSSVAFGYHLSGLQWKECYQTKPVLYCNKKMKKKGLVKVEIIRDFADN